MKFFMATVHIFLACRTPLDAGVRATPVNFRTSHHTTPHHTPNEATTCATNRAAYATHSNVYRGPEHTPWLDHVQDVAYQVNDILMSEPFPPLRIHAYDTVSTNPSKPMAVCIILLKYSRYTTAVRSGYCTYDYMSMKPRTKFKRWAVTALFVCAWIASVGL